MWLIQKVMINHKENHDEFKIKMTSILKAEQSFKNERRSVFIGEINTIALSSNDW